MNYPPAGHHAWSAPGAIPTENGTYWYDNCWANGHKPVLLEIELKAAGGMGLVGDENHVCHGYLGRWAPQDWENMAPAQTASEKNGFEEW